MALIELTITWLQLLSLIFHFIPDSIIYTPLPF